MDVDQFFVYFAIGFPIFMVTFFICCWTWVFRRQARMMREITELSFPSGRAGGPWRGAHPDQRHGWSSSGHEGASGYGGHDDSGWSYDSFSGSSSFDNGYSSSSSSSSSCDSSSTSSSSDSSSSSSC